MSYTPAQLHDIRQATMLLAHSLRREKGWSMSTALRWSWKMVRSELATKAVGVTFGYRQEALKHLAWYPARRKVVTLARVTNEHDANAVAVCVTVIGKGTVRVGFLPAYVAALIAPIMDKGVTPHVTGWEIVRGSNLGLSLRLQTVTGTSIADPARTLKIAVR